MTTVIELAEALHDLVEQGKGDLQVHTEGCDCDGVAGKVIIQKYYDLHHDQITVAYITRDQMAGS